MGDYGGDRSSVRNGVQNTNIRQKIFLMPFSTEVLEAVSQELSAKTKYLLVRHCSSPKPRS